MNLENAKKEFIKYTDNYDSQNPHIARKIGHSLRVMEISKKIAQSLNLDETQVELATLIGLLHDIGRFEQRRQYGTFTDRTSIDHGDYGVEVLKTNNYIRKFIDNDKYDDIILKAIKNHNKFMIQDGLNEEQLLFAKIIRDADKLDILYEGAKMFWQTDEEVKEVENAQINPKVYEQFLSETIIKRDGEFSQADRLLSFIAFIFDINFKYDFIVIKKEDYINKILDKFEFKDTKEEMNEVRKIANKYVESKNK